MHYATVDYDSTNVANANYAADEILELHAATGKKARGPPAPRATPSTRVARAPPRADGTPPSESATG